MKKIRRGLVGNAYLGIGAAVFFALGCSGRLKGNLGGPLSGVMVPADPDRSFRSILIADSGAL